MTWLLVIEILYVIILLSVILRVLYDTRSSTKSLAYILFIIFVPLVGIVFYFSFGINYRKRKIYSKKIIKDEPLRMQILAKMNAYSDAILRSNLTSDNYQNLIEFIRRSGKSPLTANNKVELLINGEEKFPALLTALENAKSHIHVEYYIYESDTTGNAIAEILIKKSKEGVEVRFMYDDFGSHNLTNRFIEKLQNAGVQTTPFYKIKWYALANHANQGLKYEINKSCSNLSKGMDE